MVNVKDVIEVRDYIGLNESRVIAMPRFFSKNGQAKLRLIHSLSSNQNITSWWFILSNTGVHSTLSILGMQISQFPYL
jgi:hypothetical protein